MPARRSLLLAPLLALTLALALAGPRGLGAYPGGTPDYVTDAGPFCASCHSVMDPRYHRSEPPEVAGQEVVDRKHYQDILEGNGGYADLKPEDRKKLVEEIRALDANTKATIEVPSAAKAGETVTAVVRTAGGAGPVVGVMLLDTDLRYQARTPASSGWLVEGAPRVTGPDGKPQTEWTDRRAPEVGRNVSYVNISGVASDPAKGVYPTASVAWTLRAPVKPGTYTLAAAMLYGTEKATRLGAVKSIRGVRPLGGFGGASGHIRFTEVATVEVK